MTGARQAWEQKTNNKYCRQVRKATKNMRRRFPTPERPVFDGRSDERTPASSRPLDDHVFTFAVTFIYCSHLDARVLAVA